MKLSLGPVAGVALLLCSSASDAASRKPIVGGVAMVPSRTIVENAANSKDHKILVAGVRAAGLVETLSGAGPFTVFAPTDAAFAKLPSGAVENLLKAENKAQLQTVLTYHVVSGALTSKELLAQIQTGGGKAELKTVEGELLTFDKRGKAIQITDAKGDVADVTIPDVMQANGVIHVIDNVLIP